jgi:hypothetical protein
VSVIVACWRDSSSPLTAAGRVVDVFLEIWALFVATAVAGSFAAFFSSGDA